MYELVFQREPYLNATVERQIYAVKNQPLDFKRGFILETAKNLIEKMLTIDEYKWISMNKLFEEDYFTSDNSNYWIEKKINIPVTRD